MSTHFLRTLVGILAPFFFWGWGRGEGGRVLHSYFSHIILYPHGNGLFLLNLEN